ncbi:MAG: hypothetical protein N2Z23_00795 [Pyrinomonadaceae bacterium]|nr:hypothetical protein [Pyrinomonadaceae bacterium]MCX7638971.1 hypothetical protein [Pyrinomonadaceae bacterium]MDW8303810.1 hypothetical protein [Acidobacteriota bacterium]
MSSFSNPVVKAIIEGTAPKAVRLTAARGILPLSQAELIEILTALAKEQDEEISSTAQSSLKEHVRDLSLIDVIKNSEISEQALSYLVKLEDCPSEIQEAVITNTKTPDSAILEFARKSKNASLLELVAINQQRLIRYPEIIEAILENPNSSAEAKRRALETKREFFEKERGAQQIAQELRAQGNLAAAEFIEQADFVRNLDENKLTVEDALLIAKHIEIPNAEVDDSWIAFELIEEVYEETEEQKIAAINKILGDFKSDTEIASPERVALVNRIMKMNVKDRIKLALRGDREARGILIRDPNQIVAQAVIQNPRITEQEVEKISAMRNIPEQVLRQIALNRHWARSYPIIHNLARNPRTPVPVAMNLISRLHLKDLEALSRNRNVSEAVRIQALRLSKARKSS